jgi:hypothetical protein
VLFLNGVDKKVGRLAISVKRFQSEIDFIFPERLAPYAKLIPILH